MSTEIVKAEVPDQAAMLAEADKLQAGIEAIEIDSPEMYDLSAIEVKRLKEKKTELTNKRLDITRKLDAAKTSIMDLFKPALASLDQAINSLSGKMLIYANEQERLRREEERKAREAQEAARKHAEAEVAKARENGDEVAAKAAEKVAEHVTHAPVAVTTPKTKGITKRWSFEVVDFSKLPDEYKVPNDQMLQGMATSTKGKVDVPGVRFFQKSSVTSR